MNPLFLLPDDPNRFLPSIQELERLNTKDLNGNCNKLEKYLRTIVESDLSNSSQAKDIKERCIKLISLCYQEVSQEKINPQLVLKVCHQFENWGVLSIDTFPEEVTFIDKEGNQLGINKHLLMIHSPELAKLFLSGMKSEAKIEIPDVPFSALLAFKYYIHNENLQQNLSVEDLAGLSLIASTNKIKDLCMQCFYKLETPILSDNALQHSEILWKILSQIGDNVPEKEKMNLTRLFISTVLNQNNIPYIITISEMKDLKDQKSIGLSLPNLYLLKKANALTNTDIIRQANALRNMMKQHVNCLYLTKQTDLKHLGELHLLSSKIKSAFTELHIENVAIQPDAFNNIVQHFPNLIYLEITLDLGNHQLLKEIPKMQKIISLYLHIPRETKVQETQKSEESSLKQQHLLINDPLIDLTNSKTSTNLWETFTNPFSKKNLSSSSPATTSDFSTDKSSKTVNNSNSVNLALPASDPSKTKCMKFTLSKEFIECLKDKIKYLWVSEKCEFYIPDTLSSNDVSNHLRWHNRSTIHISSSTFGNKIIFEPISKK